MKTQKFLRRYLLLPFILTVFFILFYLVYADIKERTKAEFNSEQLILAETAAQGITFFFVDYQADLAFMAQLEGIINFGDNTKELMSGFYKKHNTLIDAVTRIDADGTILYTYPFKDSLIGKNIADQTHVQEILATHKPVISDVFTSVQGPPAIALHVPIFKKDEFIGSLAILIPIDKLGKRYLGKIKIRGTGSVWLLTENGIEIYCSIEGHAGKSLLNIAHNDPAANDLLAKIKVEQKGTAKSIHEEVINDGESSAETGKYLTFYRAPLGNTYWTIIISYQEEEIYMALSRLRNRLIMLFMLLLVIMVYYFYSLTKVRMVLKEEEERKKAEKILRESEEKFRMIFNESPIGIELYNDTGMQTNANKASLKMFGISNVAEILHFNLFDGTSLNEENKQQLRNGEMVSCQALFDFEKVKALHQYKTEKNGTAYFDYVITPLTDHESKAINGYLVQVQDITERKRAEEEIFMLAHSLRSVNECVSITDMDNKILFVNEAFSKTYGYPISELIGKHVDFLRPKTHALEYTKHILPATRRGGWKGELINTRSDGTEFPIFLSTTIIHDKEGNPLGLIGVASDITERKHNEKELIKAKEKAEESDRLKSAFLANMSHEIRTPMNGILGFADLLKEPGITGEQQQSYISIIENSSARMLSIITDLVEISKIESGQINVTLSDINISEQLNFLYTIFKPETDKKGLRFSLNNKISENDTIITDKEKIHTIVSKLLKNAIKYTENGSIEIGCTSVSREHAPLHLQFYVKDTGIGIESNRTNAIFDRFVQADIEDKNALQGAGLGLSITKAYVEMLGGKIWVESKPGEGSVFYFTIPGTTAPEQNASAVITQKDAVDETLINSEILGLKVLIAEDDYASEKYLSRVISMFAKEPIKVKTGLEAVEVCRNNPDLDLILMDIKMPRLDGYDATRQIREFNKKVIIIAQTAYGLLGDREKALEAGCNDYIAKPIRKENLLALINKHFNKMTTGFSNTKSNDHGL